MRCRVGTMSLATSCDREQKRVGSGWRKTSFVRRRCGRETRWRERKRKRKTSGCRKRKGFPLQYYVQPLQPWISEYYPDLENFTTVAPVNAGLFPPVHPSSGQRHGETMEQFFARRHASNAKQKKKETPRERDIRNAREQAQVSKPYPGKKGPSVFSWDDVDGFRV